MTKEKPVLKPKRLIDAEHLSKRILDMWKVAENNNAKDIIWALSDVVTPLITSEPTVEERITAYWIEDTIYTECSHCHWSTNDEYYLGDGKACPNCGALIVGRVDRNCEEI